MENLKATTIKSPKEVKHIKVKHSTQKKIWGVIFLLPWIIGFITLFAFPFVQSVIYSFFDITPIQGGVDLSFVGFENYHYAFFEHTFSTESSFQVELLNTIGDALINLPVLLIFSLFIAVLLNKEFRGRAVIRAIFFIPVILNSTAVSTVMSGAGSVMGDIFLEENTMMIFDLSKYLTNIGIGEELVTLVVGLVDRVYTILTLSGVPILLFLAAIQSVPKHLYEAATIEGATAYEMFWLITLPNVSPHLITVSIYAIVDTFLTSSAATVISYEYNQLNWGLSLAMAWSYVVVIMMLLMVLFIFVKALKLGEHAYEN
jgi:ABC-type sugar transport system permease subunit